MRTHLVFLSGLQAGDRVTLHMPMVAELTITMLACARLIIEQLEHYVTGERG